MSFSESDNSHKRIPDEELLSTTQKRPRIEQEEEEEDGSEKKEEEPKLVVEPKKERFPPGRIYTYEDWKKDMKTCRCSICNKVGHYESDCEWTTVCPTSAVVPSFIEKVCCCCAEPPEMNHSGEELVVLRARYK